MVLFRGHVFPPLTPVLAYG